MVQKTKRQRNCKKKNRREARKIKENRDFTIFSQKISTHLLTVLTISVITAIEQKKRNRKTPEPELYSEKSGGKDDVDQK